MQRSTLAACLATIGAFVLAAPAQALNARSYVSVLGSDSADCLRPSTACRTLQGAHDKTAPKGEIATLDPGGFGGALIITKAISIVNDGVGVAGIIPPAGGAGITINAGLSDAISLRGLTIDGQVSSSGTNGIVFNSGGSLTIRDCVVRRNIYGGAGNPNTGFALLFQPNGAARLAISNSVFEINGEGVHIEPTGTGAVTAMLSRVEASNNGHGVYVSSFEKSGGSVKASIFESIAASNVNGGFAAVSKTTAQSLPARVTLMQSVSANNGRGVTAFGSQAILRVGDSMVTDNATGWIALNDGQVHSYGTNQVDGNAAADSITSKIPLD